MHLLLQSGQRSDQRYTGRNASADRILKRCKGLCRDPETASSMPAHMHCHNRYNDRFRYDVSQAVFSSSRGLYDQ